MAEATVDAIISELLGRGGFDAWWYDVDRDIRDEIKEELGKVIAAESAKAEAQAAGAPESLPDEQRGFYRKYHVERLNDPTGKHSDCMYFVLDERHDKFAGAALRAYAAACAGEFPQLAKDLLDRHGLPGQSETRRHLDQLAETIRDLPSVQREWLLEPYRRSLREALTAAEQLRKAEAQPAGTGWVRVEERLPGHSEYVLVCAQLGPDRRVVAEGQWFGALWSLHHFGQVPSNKVTHWQTKPPAPEPRE